MKPRTRAIAGCIAIVLLCLLGARHVAAAQTDAWFGQDKALHFAFSAGFAAAGYAIGTAAFSAPHDHWKSAGLGFTLAVAIGAGKEGWDALGHGDPSWRDFTWDVVGALVGVGVAALVDHFARPSSSSDAAVATARTSAFRISF